MTQTTLLQYEAPSPGHQSRPRSAFRLGIASFTEDYRNRIAIVGLQDERVLVEDDYTDYPDFVTLVEANHGYPATNLQWQPASAGGFPWSGKAPSAELLATTGDALRVWEYFGDAPPASSAYVGRQPSGGGHRLTLKTALSGQSKVQSQNTGAPLTSFSWNEKAPSLVVTSSIDTTCTVWNIDTATAITQLIAHDREVYDVAWLPGSTDIFVSVGADGSLRAFDLRSLEHSTILYETPTPKGAPPPTSSTRLPTSPLLRIAFNPADSNYMSTFHMDGSDVQILDMRSPGTAIMAYSATPGEWLAIAMGCSTPSLRDLHQLHSYSFTFSFAALILGWWISSTVLKATRGRWQVCAVPGCSVLQDSILGFEGPASFTSSEPWYRLPRHLRLAIGWLCLLALVFGSAFGFPLAAAYVGAAFFFDAETIAKNWFFVNTLSAIIFFIATVQMLYHLGVMQWIIKAFQASAWFFFKLMNISGAEAVVASASPWVGQGESACLIKPYVNVMTPSEIHLVMTSGFSTISGAVLSAYVSLGVPPQNLVTSSVMSIPASIAISKMRIPEVDEPVTRGRVIIDRGEQRPEDIPVNALHAFSKGGLFGMNVAGQILTNVLIILSLIATINGVLTWVGRGFGIHQLTLQLVLGYIGYPIAFFLGVPSAEILRVSQLLATKLIENEFAAYLELQAIQTSSDPLSPRAYTIASYSLCGFANLSSMGIQIGVLTALAPSQAKTIATLAGSAMLCGFISTLQTAAIA
ncbi:Na+ dependent nucleoside transporter C-terminus-domain-containing protein, partial [Butyriboletus roseoflavus]